MRPLVLTVVLFAPILSGCLSQDNDDGRSSVELVDKDGEGLLRVLVITDEYYPIRDASVYILELAINATTNRVGDAFFDALPAGSWTVHAERDGFLPNRTSTVVVDGESSTARIRLRDRPPDLLLADFRRETGACSIGIQADAVEPECHDTPATPSSTIRIPLESNLVWAIFEVEWEDQSVLTDSMRFEIGFVDGIEFSNGNSTLVVEGKSPLKLYVDSSLISVEMRERGQRLEIRAYPAGDAAASVRTVQFFDVYAQLVYFKAGLSPDGNTWPGDP